LIDVFDSLIDWKLAGVGSNRSSFCECPSNAFSNHKVLLLDRMENFSTLPLASW